MKTTILATVLALVTVLAAVLSILPLPLPNSVQDAQENSCTVEDNEDHPDGLIVEEKDECKFLGDFDID